MVCGLGCIVGPRWWQGRYGSEGSDLRPPLRQDMACSVVKRSPHPSQRGGRGVGFRPRRRRTPSRNSSAESSELLSKLGSVVSHAPVEAERLMRRLSIGVAVERMAVKLSSWVVLWRDLALERPLAAVFRCSCAQRGVPLRREAVRRLVSSVEAAKQEAPYSNVSMYS